MLFNKTRQDKLYKFSIKISFSSIGQDKLELQKQIGLGLNQIFLKGLISTNNNI